MDENERQQEAFKQYWLAKGCIVKIRPKLGWGPTLYSKQLYLKESERNFPCPWILRTIGIHVDGSVGQCDADWNGKYIYGNIKDRTLKSFWNTEVKEIRQKHWNLDFPEDPCRDCKDWGAGRSYFYYPKKEGDK
jgi:radical SAM protein with 4Fe4S-binding SPASM domain